MENKTLLLEKYAELAVKVGVNLKEKEGLAITCNLDGLDLARAVTKKAYEAGAKHVELLFTDDVMSLMRFEHGADYVLDSFPDFKVKAIDAMYQENYHHLFIIAPDPELLKEVPGDKVKTAQKAASLAMAPVMKYRMTGITKWSIVAVPSLAWAKSVFPEKGDDEAVEALWNLIINASRLDADDPVKAWEEHDANLKKNMHFLNEKQFEKLVLKADGTDLECYLAEDHHWIGGSNDSKAGDPYMANIPTEEVFTAPHFRKVNGTLKATKPLSLNGKLVDGFGFTFKDGQVVDFHAEKGYEVLEALMSNDEGAKYLGEVALVQHDSPISNTAVLFNNTLFDENASVHFALGRAYGYSIQGGSDMTQEELTAKGANFSLIHVDFMVGGPDLSITAYEKNGNAVELFRDGNWVTH